MLNFTPLDKNLHKLPAVRNVKGQIVEGVLGGGRPTKYREDFYKVFNEYIANAKIPTVEGFALMLDIDDDTVVEWCSIYPQFSASIKKLKMLQKSQLITDGLYGYQRVNTAMAIFLLKANHGMVDTTNVDLTSGGEKIKASPILGGNTTNVQINYGNK